MLYGHSRQSCCSQLCSGVSRMAGKSLAFRCHRTRMIHNGEVQTPLPGKVFNDSVHGHIRLPLLCVAIMDTPHFQRLHSIKQMGMVYFVYPGACNTRFEHSLGVCYLAGEMVDALNQNMLDAALQVTQTEKLCVQIAGLCHDLGHGPFSHTWEHFVHLSRPNEERWNHEKGSIDMFNELVQLPRVKQEFSDNNIGEKELEFIRNLIRGKGDPPRTNMNFLYEIVNNEYTGVDVDKWDYFLRDGHHLNINVTFDYRRLLAFSRVLHTDNGIHICYNRKEVSNISHMFRVRADLHYHAYQHRVVKIIEEMLLEGLLLADHGGYEIQGYRLSELHKHPAVYLLLTDHIFHHIMCTQSESLRPARDLITQIQSRQLYQYITTKHSEKFVAVGSKSALQSALHQKGWDKVIVLEMKIKAGPNFHSSWFFDKSNPDLAFQLNSWEEVSLFPVHMKQLQRIDLLVFSKVQLNDEDVQELTKLVTAIDLTT